MPRSAFHPASPSAYATTRLQLITAEMGLLDLRAHRYEALFAAADGDVSDGFHEAWDQTVAEWWHLAEEADALSTDLDSAGVDAGGAGHSGIGVAMARMLQAPTHGAC